MWEIVQMLEEFAKIDPSCIKTFELLFDREACFDWKEPLVRIFDERDLEV